MTICCVRHVLAGAEKGAGDSASNEKAEPVEETPPAEGQERKKNSYYDSLNIWVSSAGDVCLFY